MNLIKIDPKEKLLVKVGLSSLERLMTHKQALRYGKNAMPADLKKAGFECIVFRSDPQINGGNFYRINYGK